jgi:large conductance mechanosensitive channel
MLQEFREFIDRGNIVELAVAFVLGVTFASVIAAITDRLINPLIALLLPGLDSLGELGTFAENGSIGAVLAALINFLLVALVLFFVVRGYNRLRRREDTVEDGPPEPSEEVRLLAEIRDSLRR